MTSAWRVLRAAGESCAAAGTASVRDSVTPSASRPLPSAISIQPDRTAAGARIVTQALGARLGMQGTLGGLLASAPYLGFAYDLEIGVYPGRGGIEGYLFLALGLALEAATR